MPAPRPGDYGVVDLTPRASGARLVSGSIRLVTRSPWCHAFVVVDGGKVVEATPAGARLSSLSEYDRAPYVAYNDLEPKATVQRQVIVGAAMALLGTPYNYLDVAALALASIGVRTHRLGRGDRLICSQLVDLAYLRAGLHLFTDNRPPMDVTPEDLGMRLATRPWEVSPC